MGVLLNIQHPNVQRERRITFAVCRVALCDQEKYPTVLIYKPALQTSLSAPMHSRIDRGDDGLTSLPAAVRGATITGLGQVGDRTYSKSWKWAHTAASLHPRYGKNRAPPTPEVRRCNPTESAHHRTTSWT